MGGAGAEPAGLDHLGRLHARRRLARAPVPADPQPVGAPDRGPARGRNRLPGRSLRRLPGRLSAPDGLPARSDDAVRGASVDAPRPLPDALRDLRRDRRGDLGPVLRAADAGAGAARLAGQDAAAVGPPRGPEDAAPPALSLQHVEQHPAAGLPGPRGRVPHGRAPGGPAPHVAPERGKRRDSAPQGARAPAGLPRDPADALPGSPDRQARRRARRRRRARPQPDPPAPRRERDQARDRRTARLRPDRGPCAARRRRATAPVGARRRPRSERRRPPAERGRRRPAEHARPARAPLPGPPRLRVPGRAPAAAARSR